MLKTKRFLAGALVGLFDVAGSITNRNWLLDKLDDGSGTFADGFDFTSDLYLLHPKWLARRFRR